MPLRSLGWLYGVGRPLAHGERIRYFRTVFGMLNYEITLDDS